MLMRVWKERRVRRRELRWREERYWVRSRERSWRSETIGRGCLRSSCSRLVEYLLVLMQVSKKCFAGSTA